MSNDLNSVTLIGRLTRDPELRQVGEGNSVCNFGIANNRTFMQNGNKREQVSFFNCVAWGKLGEIINQYCQKGKQIAIQGRIAQSTYDNKEGVKVSKVEIVVDNMQLLGSNEQSGQQQAQPGQFRQQQQAPVQPVAPQPNYGQQVATDDIPF